MRYRFCGKTYTRMCCTSHPLLRKWAAKAGSNWRNLAAAVGEGTCTLQVLPSIGPACTLARSPGGTQGHDAAQPLLRLLVQAQQLHQFRRFLAGLLHTNGMVSSMLHSPIIRGG